MGRTTIKLRRSLATLALATLALSQGATADATPRPASNPCSVPGAVNYHCETAQLGSTGNRYTTYNSITETESTQPETGVAVKKTNGTFVYGAKGTNGSVVKTYPSTCGQAQCVKTKASSVLVGCSYKP